MTSCSARVCAVSLFCAATLLRFDRLSEHVGEIHILDRGGDKLYVVLYKLRREVCLNRRRKLTAHPDQLLGGVARGDGLDGLRDAGDDDSLIVVDADGGVDGHRIGLAYLIVDGVGHGDLLNIRGEAHEVNALLLDAVVHLDYLLPWQLEMHAGVKRVVLDLAEGRDDTGVAGGDAREAGHHKDGDEGYAEDDAESAPKAAGLCPFRLRPRDVFW